MDFEEFKERYQKVPVEEYPNRVVETMPEPMVSVHVSTYQHANFIHDCMEGVLMQEADFPYEIIIGEDESDDGTREICKEYAVQYPEQIRLFLHRRENNIAIRGHPTGRFQSTYSKFMARGKYIAICEGDDYWTDPKKLQKQVGFLEANEEYAISHHDAAVIDEGGNIIRHSQLPEENKCDFRREDLRKAPWLLTLSLCYRNVVTGYPPEYFKSYFSDKFIISLIGEYGKGKYQGNVSVGVYRKHKDSAWSSMSEIFRVKEKKNSYKHFLKYYKKESDELKKYYKRKHLKMCVLLFKKYINNRMYREAAENYAYVVKFLNKDGKTFNLILFTLEAIYFVVKHMVKIYIRAN